MTKVEVGVVADWLVLLSAIVLFDSLFLVWSRLSPAYLAISDRLQTLQGVPHDPTGWHVYSAADIVLALLAVGLFAVALMGTRMARCGALAAVLLALAFAIHAADVPPTNGAASAFRPSLGVDGYVAPSPRPGPGETVAIIALAAAVVGIGSSLAAD